MVPTYEISSAWVDGRTPMLSTELSPVPIPMAPPRREFLDRCRRACSDCRMASYRVDDPRAEADLASVGRHQGLAHIYVPVQRL